MKHLTNILPSRISAGKLGARKDLYVRIQTDTIKILPTKYDKPKGKSKTAQQISRIERMIRLIQCGDYVPDNPEEVLNSYKEDLKKLKDRPSYSIENQNKKGRTYNGYLSDQSKRKITRYLGQWVSGLQVMSDMNGKIAKDSQLTFITLTLPSEQMHDDKILKRAFTERFIKTITRKHGVVSYFWRAEPQKNGNIHFHLIADAFIHWKVIRGIWNKKVLEPLGYIEKYQKNAKRRFSDGKGGVVFRFDKYAYNNYGHTEEMQRRRYYDAKASNFSDPNSTDVHAIQKVENFMGYLCKYMVKDDAVRTIEHKAKVDGVEISREKIEAARGEIRKIEGRLWGCSDNIRKMRHCEIRMFDELREFLEIKVENKEVEKLEYDYATFLKMNCFKDLKEISPVEDYFKYVNLYNYADLYVKTPVPKAPRLFFNPWDDQKTRERKIKQHNYNEKQYLKRKKEYEITQGIRTKNMNRVPEEYRDYMCTDFLSFEEFLEVHYIYEDALVYA